MRVAWLVLLNILWVASAWAFLTDISVHTEPTPPLLATAGAISTDPTFGAPIIRLTDSGDSSSDCAVIYSNSSAVNRDSTKIAALCTVGYNRFKVWDFDAGTMTRSNGRIQSNSPAGFQDYGAQWSRTTSNKFYGCAGRVVYETTIQNGASTTWTNTVVRDFAAEIGGVSSDYCTQLSLSDNDNVFAFHYVKASGGIGFIAYNRSTNTILLHVTSGSAIGGGTVLDEVEIDKSGRYLVVCCTPSHVYDLQATPITNTTVTTEDFVHRGMGNATVISGCSNSRLCKRNLATPNSVIYLLFASRVNTDFHLSMRGSESWVMTCRFTTNGQNVVNPYDNECLEVSTTGNGAVRRHVHNRSNVWGGDYSAQPKGNVSQDGQFIAWTSNWNGTSTSTRNDVYVAKIVQTDSTPPSPPTAFRAQ